MTTSNPSSPYFEKVAGQWDDLRSGYYTEGVRIAAIQKAWLHPEMTVADVGAGTGFVTAGLAPLVKRVHVLDGSGAMLDVARKNLARSPTWNSTSPMVCACRYQMTASTRSLPTCTCITAPIRWLPSVRWCAFCAPAGGWSSPTSIPTPTNGSKRKCQTCGWGSNGTTCATGTN